MEIIGDSLFQLLMQVLGAADEAHGRHAVAAKLHGFFGGFNQAGIVRQAQVIVGTEVQGLAAILEGDFRTLRAGDVAFPFVKSCLINGLQLRLEILLEFSVHGYVVLMIF